MFLHLFCCISNCILSNFRLEQAKRPVKSHISTARDSYRENKRRTKMRLPREFIFQSRQEDEKGNRSFASEVGGEGYTEDVG